MRKLTATALAMFVAAMASAEPELWDMETLGKAPRYVRAEGFQEEGVQAIYYDGMPWQGKPTTVFAWYGIPKHAPGETVPAMVLVHGGGGTAFAEWVRLWNSRGYAAIAMDNCGQLPRRANEKHWERNPNGGPSGWGGFDLALEPPREQWPYHAIADVILAHSLIRSMPGVDPERIGITGISWGGYLTCIAAGVDGRFKLAAPVYGCGFLGENSAWLDAFAAVGEEKARRWLELWDPSVYLPHAKMPMLWVTGTNDFAYPMDSLQKSYRLPPGPRTLCIRLRMLHGHGGAGENPEEIRVFADSLFNKEKPLAKITEHGRNGSAVWVKFESTRDVVSAELLYTKATGKWQDRLWESAPAVVEGNTASAELPEGVTVYYLNLVDENGNVVSGEHGEME